MIVYFLGTVPAFDATEAVEAGAATGEAGFGAPAGVAGFVATAVTTGFGATAGATGFGAGNGIFVKKSTSLALERGRALLLYEHLPVGTPFTLL